MDRSAAWLGANCIAFAHCQSIGEIDWWAVKTLVWHPMFALNQYMGDLFFSEVSESRVSNGTCFHFIIGSIES